MRIITGGAGFIGSALIWELNRHGIEDIIVVDNLGESQKWKNLVSLRYADYIHKDKFRELMRASSSPWQVESVTHLGACSSTTELDADYLMDNNFNYSREVCDFALKCGARFINASSAATYGDGKDGFQDGAEKIEKLRPLNMYGYSKQLFDLWLWRGNLADKVCSLKFFNVYGPNEYHKGEMASVISKLYEQIEKTGKARLFKSLNPAYADGEQKRDFVYVKDCVALIRWLMLERPDVNGIHNVGTGHAASFREVAEAVYENVNMKPQIEYVPLPKELADKYQYYTCADMGWLKTSGYSQPFKDIRAGIKDYVRNYLAAPERYLS